MENVNLSPIEMARQLAAQKGQGGGRSAEFFKVSEGETKTIRFLTALLPMYQINHSCGANHIDIKQSDFDAAEAAGQPFLCPNCGQPLTREDIIYTRPEVMSFEVHGYVSVGDRKRSFLCLQSMMNAQLGLIDSVNGQPKYSCPICASGERVHPSTRCYGIAVEREMQTEVQNINGIPTPVVIGSKDVMVTDDDGNTHPKIVIVDMPYARFWSQLINFSEDFSQSIAYYDWQVTRTGQGTSTQYIVRCANESNPIGLDMTQYTEYMPDIKAILSRMGSAKYFTENGFAIPGYVPEQPAAQPVQQVQPATGMAAAQQVFQQVQQPVAQPAQVPSMPQPAVQNSWSAIQNQLGQR